ncbi:MAG: PH domain-containing protein [Flavobacteriales bacterium]|nr:PH domain-containing protein [Flavobacteriales bacterium]
MHQFRSRISVAILLFILIITLPIFLLGGATSENFNEGVTVLTISLGATLLLLLLLRYEIGEQHLAIKLGPIVLSSIRLNEIEKVERSYNPLSSPAGSLKRLYIKTKGKDALISPANESEFIRLLRSRNPNIEVSVADKQDWWRFWNWDI